MYLSYEHNQMILTFLRVNLTNIKNNRGTNLKKFGSRREYCSRDRKNYLDNGDFPIAEIWNTQELLKENLR